MPARVPKIKKYVDVLAKWSQDGTVVPLMIFWDDGRSFSVKNVVGPPVDLLRSTGADVVSYEVNVAGKTTRLYMERLGPRSEKLARWYVLMPHNVEPWRFSGDAFDSPLGRKLRKDK